MTRPEPLFVAAKQLTPSAGHPFNQKLNQLLDDNDKRGHSSFPMNVPFLQCRGDKTAIELFVAGVSVWEARLQRSVGRLTDRNRGGSPYLRRGRLHRAGGRV